MTVSGFSLAATLNDLQRETAVVDAADLVEFRMDQAANPLNQLADYDGTLSIIATNRPESSGEANAESTRLDDLVAAADHNAVELADVELETARANDRIVDDLRDTGVDLIVSHHDFEATPDREALDAIIEECAEYGDIAKVATSPQDTNDTLTLLRATRAATEKGIDTAGIAMGELGSHTRVVGHIYGSTLGYAPLESDETEYAPGQIPIETLASLIESIDRFGGQHGSPEAPMGDPDGPSEQTPSQ